MGIITLTLNDYSTTICSNYYFTPLPMKKVKIRSKIKLYLSLIPLFFPFSFLHINTTQAHQLKTENNISVLIHVNPDDRPAVLQPSELLFLITDKDKKFRLEDCDCQATVMFGTTTLLTQPVTTSKSSYHGIFAPALPFTFPHPGLYTITLSAAAKQSQNFEPFKISYDVWVSNQPPHTSRTFKVVYGLIVATILSASIILFVRLVNKNTES